MKKYLCKDITIWADEQGNWAAWMDEGPLIGTSDTAEPEDAEFIRQEMENTQPVATERVETWMSKKEAIKDVLGHFGWEMDKEEE